MALKENAEVTAHAIRVRNTLRRSSEEINNISADVRFSVKNVLEAVFADEQIKSDFAGAQIRYISMCGKVAQEVLHILGEDYGKISVLAIGDVDLPVFVRDEIRAMIERSYDLHSSITDPDKEGLSYDVAAKGTQESRQSMIGYFSEYYGFDEIPGLQEKLVAQTTPTSGGMRAIDDIVSAIMVHGSKMTDIANKKPRVRFVSPDNSFATWNKIVLDRTEENPRATRHTLATEQKKGLHLSAEEVKKFYGENAAAPEQTIDTWYLTPVGNPSGTTVAPEQLAETCAEIIKNNPKAIIILDTVYVRTLDRSAAKKLMHGIIHTPEILDRVIFIESLSKTHGIPGERVGAFFSANKVLYGAVQTLNMTMSAGNGRSKEAMFMSAAQTTQGEEKAISELHEFWRDEKVGLYEHLIKSGKFAELFDENQEHINEDQLRTPGGLYLFLKLKPGVDMKQVALITGCLGVEAKMGTGNYIRFSVGTLTEPTYSKPAGQKPGWIKKALALLTEPL